MVDQKKLDERTAEAGVAMAQVAGIACQGVEPEQQHVILVGMASTLLQIAVTSLVRAYTPGQQVGRMDQRFVACMQGWGSAIGAYPEVTEIERRLNETRDIFVEALHS